MRSDKDSMESKFPFNSVALMIGSQRKCLQYSVFAFICHHHHPGALSQVSCGFSRPASQFNFFLCPSYFSVTSTPSSSRQLNGGHTLLVLESLLLRWEAAAAHPGNTDTGGSHSLELVLLRGPWCWRVPLWNPLSSSLALSFYCILDPCLACLKLWPYLVMPKANTQKMYLLLCEG